jgi:hypothetical protein
MTIQETIPRRRSWDMDMISYPRFVRDMCEDLMGLYFVIMGYWLKE